MFYYEDRESANIFFVVAIILLLLSPLVALPYIVYGIYRRFRGAVVCLALFLGIFAYIAVPYQDLFRQMLTFYSCKGKPITFDDVYLNGIIVYVYSFFINNGLTFDLLRLFLVPISFILLYSILRYKIVNSNHEYTYFEINYRILILFLFYDLLYTIYGVRFGFALSLYLFGIHVAFDRHRVLHSALFLVLAAGIHQAFLLLGIFAYFLLKTRLSVRNCVILGVASFVIFTLLLSSFGQQILGARFDWYFSGKGTNTSYSHMTTFGILGFILPKICAIPFAFILFKYYDIESKWFKLGLAWFLMSIIFISNAVLFYRIWWVFMTIGVFLILEIDNREELKWKFIRRILFFGLSFTLLNSFTFHSYLENYPFVELSKPVPVILSKHYNKNDVIKLNMKMENN